jgi:alpha-beta hydrolase superfamily lysophospholipase
LSAASWFDNTRDLQALIDQKRDEMPHPLVGIGHSMGAAQL